MNTLGKRYQCGGCDKVLIVTSGGDGELHCCNASMGRQDQPGSVTRRAAVPAPGGGNKVGERLRCEYCATEVIVVTAGVGALTCDGDPLGPVAAKQIASAD